VTQLYGHVIRPREQVTRPRGHVTRPYGRVTQLYEQVTQLYEHVTDPRGSTMQIIASIPDFSGRSIAPNRQMKNRRHYLTCWMPQPGTLYPNP